MSESLLGVIGGSGLYELPGLTDVERVRVHTPFGDPSDEIVVGRLGATRLAFLPRHGRGHRLLPSELPFRANVYALKTLGAAWIVAVSAVGSLREEIAPGHVVVPGPVHRPDARAHRREHVLRARRRGARAVRRSVLRAALEGARRRRRAAQGATVHEGGAYVCMEGPQFSTRAESHLYRSWGAHVIGMTNLQEAKLAREAELCFATLALATDYDCWRTGHDDVAIEDILRRARGQRGPRAADRRRRRGRAARSQRHAAAHRALEHAIITDRATDPGAGEARPGADRGDEYL